MNMTKEDLRDCFADILSEVTDEGADGQQYMVIEAFNEAIDDWIEYHVKALDRFREVKELAPKPRFRKINN